MQPFDDTTILQSDTEQEDLREAWEIIKRLIEEAESDGEG